MRTVGLAVLVLVSSCVRTSTVTCGDLTCEAGAVCSPTGVACTTQAQIDSCRDADTPATTCTAPGDRPGVCRDGYCQEVRCGDLRMDPGEACDDGNFIAGDACSPDCTSDESCGNDVLDRGMEDCDDGNTDPHDGCNATCSNESPVWRQVVDSRFPARERHSMVYDSFRKRIVMFGGTVDSIFSNETWEYDGAQWLLRTPAISPPARHSATMAYDSVRHRVVLFGGSADSGRLADTWEWDGTSWTAMSPTTSPSARTIAGAAYDPSHAVVVLYGGDAISNSNETWEYNGTTWTNVTSTAGTTPGASAGIPLTFDAGIGRVIMFGAGGTQDTWQYDAARKWTKVPITLFAPPRTRRNHSLVYDASVGHTVLLGGEGSTNDGTDCGSGTFCGDVFELAPDTSTPGSYYWSNVRGSFTPTFGAVAYHADTQQLVVTGGRIAVSLPVESATWFRRNNAWFRLESPPDRSECQIAYLPALGGTVLFGGTTGYDGRGTLSDTWLFKDGYWSALSPTTKPPAIKEGGMVLDRARGKLVLVDTAGGTWELDGTGNWSSITTAPAPVLHSFGLAYDESRSAVILFGGVDPTKTVVADTWMYDGTTWTQLTTPTAPSARSGFAMTYDRARSVVVLFGNGTVTDSATWELSGSTWTQTSATGPTARAGVVFAYDAGRKSAVTFSGATAPGVFSGETWEYVGGVWRQASTVGPPPRVGYCSTFDETLHKTVVFGGSTNVGTKFPETWLFGYE